MVQLQAEMEKDRYVIIVDMLPWLTSKIFLLQNNPMCIFKELFPSITTLACSALLRFTHNQFYNEAAYLVK